MLKQLFCFVLLVVANGVNPSVPGWATKLSLSFEMDDRRFQAVASSSMLAAARSRGHAGVFVEAAVKALSKENIRAIVTEEWASLSITSSNDMPLDVMLRIDEMNSELVVMETVMPARAYEAESGGLKFRLDDESKDPTHRVLKFPYVELVVGGGRDEVQRDVSSLFAVHLVARGQEGVRRTTGGADTTWRTILNPGQRHSVTRTGMLTEGLKKTDLNSIANLYPASLTMSSWDSPIGPNGVFNTPRDAHRGYSVFGSRHHHVTFVSLQDPNLVDHIMEACANTLPATVVSSRGWKHAQVHSRLAAVVAERTTALSPEALKGRFFDAIFDNSQRAASDFVAGYAKLTHVARINLVADIQHASKYTRQTLDHLQIYESIRRMADDFAYELVPELEEKIRRLAYEERRAAEMRERRDAEMRAAEQRRRDIEERERRERHEREAEVARTNALRRKPVVAAAAALPDIVGMKFKEARLQLWKAMEEMGGSEADKAVQVRQILMMHFPEVKQKYLNLMAEKEAKAGNTGKRVEEYAWRGAVTFGDDNNDWYLGVVA